MSRVGVVGAGVAGLSVALALKQRDPMVEVLLFDGHGRKSPSASMASGAMLNAFAEVTTQTFSSPAHAAYFNLTLKAMSTWPAWLENVVEGTSFAKQDILPADQLGTYILLNAQSGWLDSANFKAIRKALCDFNEPHQTLDGQDVPGLDPIPLMRPLDVLHVPRECYVHTPSLMAALKERVTNLGVSLVPEAVERLVVEQGHIRSVRSSSDQRWDVDHVVLASGTDANDLLDGLPGHLSVPLFYGVGSAFLAEPPPSFHPWPRAVYRTPVRAGGCGAYMVPQNHGNETLCYMGATNYMSSKPGRHAKIRDMSNNLERIVEQMHQGFHDGHVRDILVGNRSFSLDMLPCLGRVTAVEGLSMVAGMGRDGLHNSPITAPYITSQVLGEPMTPEMAHFQPERSPHLAWGGRQQAVENFVYHFMSAGYDHGMRLPRIGWDAMLASLMPHMVEDVYTKFGDLDVGLHHDVLVMLLREPNVLPSMRRYLSSCTNTRGRSALGQTVERPAPNKECCV